MSARLIRLAILLLSLCAGAPAVATVDDHAASKIAVTGDSLVCPQIQAGEISVCSDKISAASLLNLQAYASCLVRYHRLTADLATRAYAARRDRDPLRALIADDHGCMPAGGARMSAILLASALAEHLPGWRGRLHAGFARADHPADMIQCLIAANPGGALAVLRSPPLSDDEANAVHRLVPSLAACLPAQVQLATNRAALRAMLALALLDPDSADGLSVDLSTGPVMPELGHPAAPLLVAMPRIAVTPLVTVGAPRKRNDPLHNPTLPGWTVVEDTGLHHGGYDHPDLPPQRLPEDELSQFAQLPGTPSGDPPGSTKSAYPGETQTSPQDQ